MRKLRAWVFMYSALGSRPRCILRTPRQSELRGGSRCRIGSRRLGNAHSARKRLRRPPSGASIAYPRFSRQRPTTKASVRSVRKRSTSRPSGAGIARPISPRVGDDCVVCLDVRRLLRPHSSHEGYGREGYGHARLSVQDRPMKGVPTSISMTREHGVSWSPASTTAFTSCVIPLPSVHTPSSSSVPPA